MDAPPGEGESGPMRKMRTFYNSCYNTEYRDESQKAVLSSFLHGLELVDVSYVLGDVLDFGQPQQWTSLVSKLEEYRLHALFEPSFVRLHLDSPAPEKMDIGCKVPFLNPKAYSNSSNAKLTYQRIIYRDAMVETFKLFGMNWTTSNELADEVLEVEADIAKAVLNAGLSSRTQLSEGATLLLKSIWLPVVGEAIQDMEIESTCQYDLEVIVNTLKQMPNQRVVQYIFWRMMMGLLPDLGSGFRGIHYDYLTKLPNTKYGLKPKWRGCADVLRSEFGLVAYHSLIQNGHVKIETLDAVHDVFENLKRDLALVIGAMDHVDEEFLQVYNNKVKHMKLSLGHHYNASLNEDILDRTYDELDFGEDHFSNALKLKRFKSRKHLAWLWYRNDGDPIMGTSWDEDPLGSTASYDYQTNTVNIELGLLRPPLTLYSENLPGYLKYGYSSLIARQMSRAFDSKGKHINDEGIEITQGPVTENKLEELKDCLRNQLSRIVSPHLLDTPVLENIMTDFPAFALPHSGMHRYLRSHSSEKPLPGLSLSKKQTYFVQVAQMMCELRDNLAKDDKGMMPPDLRVNQVIMNIPDFGDIFNCPSNSPMVPLNKCNFMG